MFEDSLFASGGTLEAKRGARKRRRLALVSVALQGLVVACFIAVPLVWPERLPLVSVAPKMTFLALKKPEVKVPPKPLRLTLNSDVAMHVPAPMVEQRGGGVLSHGPSQVQAAGEGLSLYHAGDMSGPSSLLAAIDSGGAKAPTIVTAAPKRSEPLSISQGVSRGMLLAPIKPEYPRMAIASHVQGTVILTATIDRQGRITGLQVLSGPEMLRRAASDAIREARYRPYLLNGQPTDVITTISVVFTMGG